MFQMNKNGFRWKEVVLDEGYCYVFVFWYQLSSFAFLEITPHPDAYIFVNFGMCLEMIYGIPALVHRVNYFKSTHVYNALLNNNPCWGSRSSTRISWTSARSEFCGLIRRPWQRKTLEAFEYLRWFYERKIETCFKEKQSPKGCSPFCFWNIIMKGIWFEKKSYQESIMSTFRIDMQEFIENESDTEVSYHTCKSFFCLILRSVWTSRIGSKNPLVLALVKDPEMT